MRRWLLLLVLLLPVSASRADALTIRDIVELTKAGLGEDVLMALIEVDRTVFAIDRETITSLKQAGVSERIIVAMIRSGRAPEPASVPEPSLRAAEPARAEPVPQVIVVDREPRVEIREVPVPVYMTPIYRTRGAYGPTRYDTVPRLYGTTPNTGSPYYVGQVPPPTPPPAPPQYWGWGGQLRPDAWKPAEPARGGRADRRDR